MVHEKIIKKQNVERKNKKEGKGQESIQSSNAPDPVHHIFNTHGLKQSSSESHQLRSEAKQFTVEDSMGDFT